jgi:hypothetical protein
MNSASSSRYRTADDDVDTQSCLAKLLLHLQWKARRPVRRTGLMKDEEESDGKKTAAGTQDVLTTTEVAVAAMVVEYSIGVW